MATASVTQLKPTRAASLLAACRELSARRLPETLRFVLNQADDALFELANKADNSTRQNLYFDAMRELRLKRDEFETCFSEALEKRMDAAIERSRTDPNQAGSLATGELSLIEIDVVEQTLAVTNFADSFKARAREALFALNKRMAVLLGDTTLDDEDNPFGPRQIGDALRDACQLLDADVEIKLTLLKLFERCGGPAVAQYFGELNNILVDGGVLPEIQQRTATSAPRKRTRVIIESEQDSTEASGDDVFSTLAELMQRAPGRGGNNGGLGAAVSNGDVSVRAAGQGRHGAGAVGYGGVAGGATGQGAGGVGGSGGGSAGTAGGAGGGGALLGGAPLMQGLTTLQRGHETDSPLWSMFDSGAIAAGNVNVLHGLRDGAGIDGAAPAEKLTVEIVSLLFDYILEDPAIPDALKALIGRLQIPVLKVALLDRDVFSRKQHPARRLLDELARASIGWSEGLRQQDALYDKVDHVVHRILDEFEDDVALFSEVLDEFMAFVDSESEAASERAAASSRSLHTKERIIQAKLEVDEALGARIAELDERVFIKNFILDYWRQLLIVTLIEQGRDSDAWAAHFATFEELIWSAQPMKSAEDRKALTRRLPPLVQGLKAGMQTLDMPPADRSRFLSMLASVHVASVRSDEEVSLAEQRLAEAQIRINARRVAADAKISARRAGNEAVIDLTVTPDESATVARATSDPSNDEFIKKGLERIFQQKEAGPVELDIDFTVFGDGGDDSDTEAPATDQPLVGDSTLNGSLAPAAGQSIVDCSDLVATLDLGDWLEIHGADGGLKRVRFTWISPDTGRYLFTTRAGDKALETTMLDLAAMVRDDQAHIVKAEPDPLFERALGALIEKLEAGEAAG